MNETNIKNLSIGWVVEANIVSGLTPGYRTIRKIVYRNYDEYGTDVLYKNGKFPIIYPIVEFKKDDDTALVSNGEYVILPYGSINNYLKIFGISCDGKLSWLDKVRIKNIVLDKSKVVGKTIWNRNNINSELLTDEIEKLINFKTSNNSVIPDNSEYEYLENLTKVYY